MKTLALGLGILLLIALTACGGGMNTTNNPPPPPPPVVNANVAVGNTPNGGFNLAMSTSFQPAEWDNTFFQSSASARETLLGSLESHHIRLQTVSQGIPQTSATTWDFTVLDDITQPVLSVSDHSPEMQLGWAPSFMWSGGSLDATQFSTYAADMVSYYNDVNGFTAADGKHVSPSGLPIQWWGILNEPSINNIPDAATYTQIYNQVVPAMLTAKSSVPIKFVALELCCGSESWTQGFAASVTAQVDAVGTHYYSSCNQSDTDAQVFATVPGFASSVQSIYSFLSASGNPLVTSAPVWITENNVNADFSDSTGHSTCHPSQVFVTDARGSSAFFAAWRPYVFSQVGKAGAQALYHWDFDADPQFGEVDYNTAQTKLSYWVDYWLGQMFPPGTNQQVLQYTNSDNTDIEVLPVLNTDNSVVILVSNHAVASPTDNNGAGLTADISIDTSALGSFSTASELVMDSTTSPTTGPSPQSISPASPMRLTLNGYSSALIKLK